MNGNEKIIKDYLNFRRNVQNIRYKNNINNDQIIGGTFYIDCY